MQTGGSGLGDAAFLLYGIVRATRPTTVVEIGSATGAQRLRHFRWAVARIDLVTFTRSILTYLTHGPTMNAKIR